MLKKFYKLYHYIATIFYPDVIEEISTNIAFLFCDKRLNSQNKISKLFWSIVGNICNFYIYIICYVIENLLYWIGKTFYPETGEYEDYDYSDLSNFA